jgi:hypothetical protein
MRDEGRPRTLVLASLVVAALVSTNARAQQAKVDAVEIVGFGIFSSGKVLKLEQIPGTDDVAMREDRKLVTRTDSVPGLIGTTFGVQFTLHGTPPGALVKLTCVTRFPPPGVLNDKGRTLDKSQSEWNGAIGQADIRTFTFADPRDIVAGDWSMEFYYAGRKIGEQRFTVTAAGN